MLGHFKSIEDVCNNLVFAEYVREHLTELCGKRRNRPEPPAGFKYKRDWYNRMRGEQLTAEYFVAQIPAIWEKRSDLSSEVRAVIQMVCGKALLDTHKHYGVPEVLKEIEEAEKAQCK